MDASAGATRNGDKAPETVPHAVPTPVSLPSAVAAPEGAPVSSATPAPAAGAPDVERDEHGRLKPGKSLNPKGRKPGATSLNTELMKAIKAFRIGSKGYLELFLTRSLQDVEYAKLITPKIFGNVDQPAGAGISIHNNPQASASAAATTENNYGNARKLLADEAGRGILAAAAERLAAGSLDTGAPRHVRQ
jgi:hypothetical protein